MLVLILNLNHVLGMENDGFYVDDHHLDEAAEIQQVLR